MFICVTGTVLIYRQTLVKIAKSFEHPLFSLDSDVKLLYTIDKTSFLILRFAKVQIS
jgi:hypothetical protein